ncbi:hypothetical protein PINS_up022749, partial [Pythium insidiosum]
MSRNVSKCLSTRTRWTARWSWVTVAVMVASMLASSTGSLTAAQGVAASTPNNYINVRSSATSPTSARTQDVVVAGGIDGRVYALNAWTGDILWMFDSGGPMVDSSNCGTPAADPPPSTPSPTPAPSQAHTKPASSVRSVETATVDVSGQVVDAIGSQALAVAASRSSSVTAARAAMDQMIPSYDGRLYHIAGSS